jgi:murein DD-endopeptidase MepM/ murein hydrolase activator NlpD
MDQLFLSSFQPPKTCKMRRESIFLWAINLLLLVYIFFIAQMAHSSEGRSYTIVGKIKEGEAFSQSLAKKKISLQWINLIVSKLRPFVDFRRIRGGESYQLITDGKGEFVKFIYKVSLTEIYEIEKDPKGEYIATKKKIPLNIHLGKVEREIRSSLAKAMKEAGENWSLATAFAEILAWEMDFSQDAREGDRFKVVEKIYKGDEFIKYGTIYALEYRSGKRTIRGIRFKNRYYDEKGYSLEKAFLKMPLRFKYISSGFNRNRRHPIMGGIRPHLGIDYAAPIGTPVWAVADGVVDSAGWVEGFGRQVVLRHPNGYMSYYSHLSKYGPGIKRGRRVEQKQIIGYVGTTGFSTGPHLDYRLTKNGQFINPQKEIFPTGKPIGQKEMEAFCKKRDEAMAWLNAGVPFKKRLKEGRLR